MNDQDKTPDVSAQPEAENNEAVNAPAEADSTDPKLSRRRALLAGLAAAPVIFTLMNRSAIAGTVCTSQALINSYTSSKNAGATAIASFTTRHKNVTYNTTTGKLECN